jgi:hypothetical protein
MTMTKIRIAVVSALLAALVAGSAVFGASAGQPAHAVAGPRACCSAPNMSTN